MVIRVKGIQRKTENVEVEVSSASLLEACSEGLANKEFYTLLRTKAEQLCIKNSDDLRDKNVLIGCEKDVYFWTAWDYYDPHKREEVYKKVRNFSEEELQLFKQTEELIKTYQTFGE